MVDKRHWAATALCSMLMMWQTNSVGGFIFTTSGPYYSCNTTTFVCNTKDRSGSLNSLGQLPDRLRDDDGNSAGLTDPPGPRSWPLVGNMLSAAKEGSLPG